MREKPQLHQLKTITFALSIVQASLTVRIFSSVLENILKEGVIPCVENKFKASPAFQAC